MVFFFEPSRLVAAALLVLVYAGMCAAIFFRRRRVSLSPDIVGEAEGWLIVHASQTGRALDLARETRALFESAGLPVSMIGMSRLDLRQLGGDLRVLFIVSTYGEGDPPDEGSRFFDAYMSEPADLGRLHYAVLALGDDSYRHFCGFGRRLDGWLRECGAQPCFERLEMNRGDEAVRQQWRRELIHLAGTRDVPDWEGPTFDTWKLAAREHLNPDSQGEPVYRLVLVPQSGQLPVWEAGDLVQIRVPGVVDHPREYSIASLPESGGVELLVRLHKRDDGSTGLASGWLATMPPGDGVLLRISRHESFRVAGNQNRPLIAIGNGTGLAGLVAHIRQRERQAWHPPCWLFFGERQHDRDFLLRDEIVRLQNLGVLARCDAAFSRDGGAYRYVQSLVSLHEGGIREWVAAGAAIYVCGSLQGMAGEVHQVLVDVLGEEVLEELRQEGRYRRDVY